MAKEVPQGETSEEECGADEGGQFVHGGLNFEEERRKSGKSSSKRRAHRAHDSFSLSLSLPLTNILLLLTSVGNKKLPAARSVCRLTEKSERASERTAQRAIGDDEAENDSDCVGVSLLIALYSTLLLLLFSHSSPTSLPR